MRKELIKEILLTILGWTLLINLFQGVMFLVFLLVCESATTFTCYISAWFVTSMMALFIGLVSLSINLITR